MDRVTKIAPRSSDLPHTGARIRKIELIPAARCLTSLLEFVKHGKPSESLILEDERQFS